MMQTQMRAKLAAAKDRKDNDVNSFVWKSRKIEVNGKFEQESIKLIDCSLEQLQQFYDHCNTMLYNTSKDTPGRYPLLDIVKDQIQRCNAELFLRWIAEEPRSLPRFTFMSKIREVLNNNPHVNPKENSIDLIVGGCPKEFENLPIDLIQDGCLDCLGKFDRRHITLTFILKQGLWFTSQDKKDLEEYYNQHKDSVDSFKAAYIDLQDVDEKLVSVKQMAAQHYLGLKPSMRSYINPKGLSLPQMRAMVKLTSAKYSTLTTMQLTTLRDRMLFTLEDEIKYHINQWETRKQQLCKVAEAKGFTLNTTGVN